MVELPLFPLNTVLFPGMPLQLHIFEERYKQMIGECIDQQRPFGVVLIRKGRAEYGPLAEPYTIGCTAKITQVQPLDQGRMNIVAIGQERFRIQSINRDQGYLVATTEPFPLRDSDSPAVKQLGDNLRSLLGDFLRLLKQFGQIRHPLYRLPNDPIALAYLAAILIHMPAIQQQVLLADLIASEGSLDVAARFYTFVAQQQVLLQTENAVTLLEDLITIYRRETALIQAIIELLGSDPGESPFSTN